MNDVIIGMKSLLVWNAAILGALAWPCRTGKLWRERGINPYNAFIFIFMKSIMPRRSSWMAAGLGLLATVQVPQDVA
ncbi:hypothetical protein CCR95_02065 [Thiocystis minor]|nr:hypothetical protein [Thiocystis minor]